MTTMLRSMSIPEFQLVFLCGALIFAIVTMWLYKSIEHKDIDLAIAKPSNISFQSIARGFTIIEVLIVLAIAGLILLIVFMAVPALQRNQRNSARRGDASRIAAAIISFAAGNNSVVPGGSTYSTTTAVADTTAIKDSVGTLGQYILTVPAAAGINTADTSGELTMTTGAQSPIATTVIDAVNIAVGSDCIASGGTAVGNAKSVAVQFTVETGNAAVSSPSCKDAQ